jgi:aspartate 1-decarboxylase
VRKTAAILLTLIFFFNLCGYHLLIDILQQKADTKLEVKLDNSDYDEAQLIEIRVPMNMPYQQRYTEFERHYGEIEIDGKSYTYVKRKIEGDMLILKCIANQSKEELKTIKNDLVKANSNADMDHSGNNSQQKSFAKNTLGEYDDQFTTQQPLGVNNMIALSFSDFKSEMPEGVTTILHQPPKAC